MAGLGAELHERLLEQKLEQLRRMGCRVANLRGASPDAIAVSPTGKLIAIDILGTKTLTPGEYQETAKDREKEQQYLDKCGFDQLNLIKFSYLDSDKPFDQVQTQAVFIPNRRDVKPMTEAKEKEVFG